MVSVKKVVMDFERGLWAAEKTRLPHVEVWGVFSTEHRQYGVR